MAPQRNADAANVSPYPFVVHQVPSPPQEQTDRSARPSKAKKRLRQRQERSDARQGQEEERRFNVGPRRTTTHGTRRAILPPPRALPNGVPDYPPPSFEETVNRPSMSVCSSTTSLVSVLPTPPLAIPEDIPEDQPPPSPAAHSETTQKRRAEIDPVSEASASDNASESDESALVIINKNEIPVSSNDLPRGRDLEAKIKKDWLKRRGVDFPTASSSDPPKVSNTLPRGRKPARPTLLIDPAVANSPYMSPTSPLSSPKRRFLSLSPIRTIFPTKNIIQEDKAHSAHPSPISTPPSSPYTGSKSFFRSTTSLATVSFLRLPGVSSSSQSQSTKGSLSRRLFSFKGKAKEIVVDSVEDAWEVVPKNAGEDELKKEEHPASLLAMVESSMNGSAVTLAKASPTRSTFSVQSSPNRLQSALTSPSVVSLQNKTPVTPFLERSVNRRSMNISPTIPEAPETPTATAQTPTTGAPSTPPQTPTKITETSSSSTPPPKPVAKPPPPLRMETRPNHKQLVAEPLVDDMALETPLPMTPVYQTYFENNTPPNVNALKEQIRSPIPIHPQHQASHSVADFFDEPEPHTPPPTEQGCVCGGTPHSKGRSLALHELPPHPMTSVYPHHPSGFPTQTQVSLLMRPSINDEPMTPTKHQQPNYHARRPLPRPPPGQGLDTPPPASVTFSRAHADVDSIYSSLSMTNRSSPTGSIPEGHLIDLEDTTLDSCISPTSTEATTGSRYDHPDAQAYSRRYEPDVHSLSSGPSSSNNSVRERSGLLTSGHPDLSFGSSSFQASSTPPGAYSRPPLPPVHQQVKALLPPSELSARQQQYLQQQQLQFLRSQQQRHLQTLHQPKWEMTREYSQATDPSDIYGSEAGPDREESVVEEEDDEEVVYFPQHHRRRGSSPLYDSSSPNPHSYHYPSQRRSSNDFNPSRDNATWIRDPTGVTPNSRGGYGGSSISLAVAPSSRELGMHAGSGSTYTLPLQQSQYIGHSLDSSHRQRQNAAPWAY
ncbi:hypothetical protein CPB83DRAFT_909456 [Crepidotus variabilis]|uniref:Uncharacterized protein n=1 Tax=Crepidotus variabilis TaxID=179855 RepID=A0A9P6E9T0_9AGAR|nr:hypothetical protein CPB83DRAFT_909456 [Crepidotus variabilis]